MFLCNGSRVCSDRSGVCTGARRSRTARGAMMELAEPRVFLSAATSTASQLVIIQEPVDAIAGNKNTPIIVDALDSSGNVVIPPPHTKVTLTLTNSSGAMAGQFTAPLAKDGEAIFKKVAIAKVGTYTVQAQDGSLTSQVSHSFAITPAKGSGIMFSQSPVDPIAVGQNFSVQLLVVDRFGNVTADSQHRVIKVSLGSHPRLAVLYGLSTETTDNGQISFSNLSVSLPGYYTLKATMGKAGTKSAGFSVSYSGTAGAAILPRSHR